MICQYLHLSQHPKVFESMTSLSLGLFAALLEDIEPRFAEAEFERLDRPGRQRAIGGGRNQEIAVRDQLLMSVIWLRSYPKQHVLAYLFDTSEASVSRVLNRMVPLLEASGRDTMRLPDPGRKQRRELDELLRETPELALLVDTFEQRVQRHKEAKVADTYYSGKKKQHTLKSQVAVDETTGLFVDVSESVAGPTADITLLKQSGLLERLPEGLGALADLASVGIDKLHPTGDAACPRRKPPKQPRPPDDIAFNTAFAKRRIYVEHAIGRARRFEAINQLDRHHRRRHTARVVAVCGLVNPRLAHRLALRYPDLPSC